MNELDPTFGTDITDLTPKELEYIAAHRNSCTLIVNTEHLSRLYDELGRPLAAEAGRRSIEAHGIRISAIDRGFLGSLLEKAAEARARNTKLAPQ